MLDIDKAIKNLIGLKLYKNQGDDAVNELRNDIICVFEGNEQDIYVETIGENGFSGEDGYHRAYENTVDSQIIEFCIEDGEIVTAC